ncbi:alginate O-acetyltransferase AlgX-related protein [Candidatus Electrothrix sp.]|uniref:alginate O-acetyltransferase AlgX-related protein n=1 Tax=Candidatus Electrothrix sp. TaxID=2170559 RepID=UPI00405696C9
MSFTRRVYPAAVSGIFLLFLLLPFCLFMVGPRKEISEAEKRKLAVFPEIVPTMTGLTEFPKKFDAFYRDHFGLRDNLIRLYNLLSLKIFHVSPSDFVLKGKEGWFFYIGEGVFDDFSRMEHIDQISLEQHAATLIDRRNWLASFGVRYLFVPVPNKIFLYDEYLPDRVQGVRGMNFYEQFTAFLEREIFFEDFINLYPVLRDNKQAERLYFKTDTHWSNAGALLAFNQIMKRCSDWFPEESASVIEKEIERENVTFSGDLARLMHQEGEVTEQVDVFKIKKPCAEKKNTHPSPTSQYLQEADISASRLPTENGCLDKTLTALIVHDSFGIPLQRYFNERFKRVIYSRQIKLDKLQKLIVGERPDIVIEIWVARNLGRALAPNPAEWTTKVLEEQYAASETVRMRIDGSLDLQRISLRNHVSLERHADGLLIHAHGNDPFFVLPFTPPEKPERYLVEVEVDAPQNTTFALYFTIGENTRDIAPQQVVEQKIHKGKNRLLLRLPHPDVRGLLRIDPGKKAGNYLLRSLTVKGVAH